MSKAGSLRSLAQESATAEVPHPTDSRRTEDTLSRFRYWLEQKQQKEDFGHSYTLKKARKRFAKAKDVDRYFSEEYEAFTTVFVTYCNGVRSPSESVVENAESLYSNSLKAQRWRILNQLDVDEYAGVSLLAPKHCEVPHPSGSDDDRRLTTHAHDFLWIPGTDVSEEDFTPLVEGYAESVAGYSAEQAVSVEHHTSSEVATPFDSETDRQRGATTALPQELGRNLPLLDLSFEQGRYDARDAPDFVEEWCAHLRLGTDRTTETEGIRRFRPLGDFHKAAETTRTRRRLRSAEAGAQALAAELEVPHPSYITQVEQQFVNQYLEEVSDPSEQRIERELERNIRRGKLPPDTDIQGVVGEIHSACR